MLVGKKSAIKYYGKKFKYDFSDKSGTRWYENQKVMKINSYGNCQEIRRIQSYDNGIIILDNGE